MDTVLLRAMLDAVNLMKKAWGNIEDRPLEEVSVIDIIDEEDYD